MCGAHAAGKPGVLGANDIAVLIDAGNPSILIRVDINISVCPNLVIFADRTN